MPAPPFSATSPPLAGAGRASGPATGVDGAWPARLDWVWVALAAVLIAAFHDLRHDDAYITFRYGQNLARGLGWTFNPGELMQGATSPGQALIAAGLYQLVGQQALPSAMASLGALAAALQGALASRLTAPFCGWRFGLVAGFAAALGAGVGVEWLALETPLALAAALGALLAAERSRWRLTGGLVAVAALLRPDYHLLALLLLAAGWWCCRRRILPAVGVWAALSLPWILFATVYFGSWLPQSAATKFDQVPMAVYLFHELVAVPGAVAFLGAGEATWSLPAELLRAGVFWLLVAAGAWAGWRRNRLFVVPACFLVGHALVYAWMGPFLAHRWHLQPQVTLAALFALAGLLAVRTPPTRRAIHLLILGLALSWGLRTAALAADHAGNYWLGARDQAYLQVVAWLQANAAPDDAVAALEVGTLAYWSDRRMVDLGGLITPRARLAEELEAARWLVLDERVAAGEFPELATVSPVASLRSGDFRAVVYDRFAAPAPPGLPAENQGKQ